MREGDKNQKYKESSHMYSYWKKIKKNPNPTAHTEQRLYNLKHLKCSTYVWGDQLTIFFYVLGKSAIIIAGLDQW